ncbi:MAG: hypothetical protein KatS3mg105_4035 [Gemmatales bacterium]|nr:MAG: hypothetical protein KatS3mg105_4035 [Gemmatales bacterium]
MSAQPAEHSDSSLSATRNWLTSLAYDTTYFFSAAALTFGWSLRVKGVHHVPKRGRALFIANHQSFLDPLVTGLAIHRRIWFLARKTLFSNRWFGKWISMINAVPVDQEGIGIEGLRLVLKLLKEEQGVLVFPEGQRTPTGEMMPFQPGVHFLVKRAMAPVIPVAISGAYDAWPRWRRFPIPAPLFLPDTHRTIAVVVGSPIPPTRLIHLSREKLRSDLFHEIKRLQKQADRLRRPASLPRPPERPPTDLDQSYHHPVS